MIISKDEYFHHNNHNTPANYSNWFKGSGERNWKKNSEEGPTSLQRPKGPSRAWPLFGGFMYCVIRPEIWVVSLLLAIMPKVGIFSKGSASSAYLLCLSSLDVICCLLLLLLSAASDAADLLALSDFVFHLFHFTQFSKLNYSFHQF